ncbi:hypothetical protein QJQ45_014391 [Haematococcus lacustris]|nr:hypothetical protein QJQ45_014391 [Haematococcus lacustris]
MAVESRSSTTPPDNPSPTSKPPLGPSHQLNYQPPPTRPASTGLTLAEMVRVKLAASSDAATFYPNHGFGRGGVGTLVATGSARSGLSRLPHAHKSSYGTTTTRALSAGSATSLRSQGLNPPPYLLQPPPGAQDPLHPPLGAAAAAEGGPTALGRVGAGDSAEVHRSAAASACYSTGLSHTPSVFASPRTTTRPQSCPSAMAAGAKPWEQGGVAHPASFQPATRRSRIHDVPRASRWAAISFYETDPAEIKRHIDIVEALEQLHAHSKEAEVAEERARHRAWGAQQRNTFRRQRAELALKYQALGLPPRPSYAFVNLAAGAEPQTTSSILSGAAPHPTHPHPHQHQPGGSNGQGPDGQEDLPPGSHIPGYSSLQRGLPPPAFPPYLSLTASPPPVATPPSPNAPHLVDMHTRSQPACTTSSYRPHTSQTQDDPGQQQGPPARHSHPSHSAPPQQQQQQQARGGATQRPPGSRACHSAGSSRHPLPPTPTSGTRIVGPSPSSSLPHPSQGVAAWAPLVSSGHWGMDREGQVGGGAAAQAQALHVSLPAPTFVKVFDRMAAEVEGSARLREAEWRAGREEARTRKEAAEVRGEVHELDRFDDHLRHISRLKARHALQGGDDDDT